MRMKPLTVKPDLQKLLREAAAKVAAMSPDEREAMMDQQRKSYVRAEMSWPRDCPYR